MMKMLDIKLENCHIFSNGENKSIGIGNGKILLIDDIIYEQAKQTVDMKGSFVVPGFIDSHTHLVSLGLENIRISLYTCKNRNEAIDRIKTGSNETRRKVVIAYKWDESLWGDDEYLSRSELDVVSKPVIAFRRDGHMATLNSSALRLVGREGVKDGVLKEKDLGLLDKLVSPEAEERISAFNRSQEIAISEGVTAVRDMVDRETYFAYNGLKNRIRIFRTLYDRDMFKGVGIGTDTDWGIKTFLDGSIGALTAAHEGWDGKNLIMNATQFETFCNGIWSNNLPVAAHAIGEMAVETAVNIFSRHSGRFRNSIEHFELMPEEVLEKLNKSVVISSQPNFLDWAGEGGMYENRLGREWLTKNNPFRDIIDAGIPLAFGSDTMPLGPMYGIHQAVNSKFRQQKITVNEAVRCYSEGGSYLLGRDQYMGKIEEGYLADLAVFDHDFTMETGNLKDIKPVSTMIVGRFC